MIRSIEVIVTKVILEKKEFQDVIDSLRAFHTQEVQRGALDEVRNRTLHGLIKNLETIAPDGSTSSYVIERIISHDSLPSDAQPKEQESVCEKRGLIGV